MKPYYTDDSVTIYHGDAAEVMPTLEQVDVVITSPPYNMGITAGGIGGDYYRPPRGAKGGRFRDGYGIHTDDLPHAEYDQWQRRMLKAMWDLASCAVFYNHRPRVQMGLLRLPLGMDFGELPLRQIIVWDRGTGIDVALHQFCTRQEWIFLFAKPEFRLVDFSASGQGDVWRLGMETQETGHPAPFPVRLPSKILATTGAASVLDPFMGSGSTLRAAKDLGRKAIGIEIEERYCEVAANRMAQEAFGWEDVA